MRETSPALAPIQLVGWLLLALCLPLLLWQAVASQQATLPQAAFLSAHAVLEIFSIAISALVFFIAFGARDTERSRRVLWLGCFFLATALLDTIHTLSYPGVPDFISPNSADKMIWFWLAARFSAALGLLFYALQTHEIPVARRQRTQALLLTLALVAGIVYAIIAQPATLPTMHVPGQGLTGLKIALEWLVVAILLLSALLCFLRRKQLHEYDVPTLILAILLMAAGELFFTVYVQVSSTANLLGHVYKVIAYYFLYRAIFTETVRRPFLRIAELKHEVEQERDLANGMLNTAPVIILLLDPQGRIRHVNPYFEQLTGFRLDAIRGRDWFDTMLPEAERGHIRTLFQQAAGGKATRGQVNAILTREGAARLIEWHDQRLFDQEGRFTGLLAIGQDVTERQASEDALRQSASVFEHANEGILITDAQGQILDVNTAFTRITGYSREEVLGKNPRLLQSGWQGADFYAGMWRALKTSGHWSGEIWNRRKTGDTYPELLTISAVRDEAGEVTRYVGLFSDISPIKAQQAQLEHIAHYDALTHLPNRTLLADRMHQAIAHAQRHQTLLGIAYLDLDGFKEVNDRHGHEMGDQLLIQLSARMRKSLREGDTLARLGGDEFVIVLNDLDQIDASLPMLDRLLDAAAEPVHIDGLVLQVSASIGVTFYPQDDDIDADQLLRQADQAMYQAKQAGKHRYHLFDTEHDRHVRGRHESLDAIRTALANEEFVLHYQPKVNMRTGQVIGAEALIRWQHPERGLLPPAAFLSVIENHELSIDIGEWVLATALSQVESWRDAGLTLPVSVNIDALHFQQPNFVARLQAELARHPGIAPGDLELEILETAALGDLARFSEVMLACQALGVGFALDDFGTGYSSLTYLKRLPVQLLKIDQSFVRDMLEDPDDLAILDGILGLANAFRRDAIAEGVETLDHGEMLLRMGCELGQGYAIARPMSADAIHDWLRTWQPNPAWQHCTRLSREAMPILYAMIDHRSWVSAFNKYVRGELSEPPPLDSHRCRFDQWLDTIRRSPLAKHPAMASIEALHEAAHRLGQEWLATIGEGGARSVDDARLAEMETLRDALIAALQDLLSTPRSPDSEAPGQ